MRRDPIDLVETILKILDGKCLGISLADINREIVKTGKHPSYYLLRRNLDVLINNNQVIERVVGSAHLFYRYEYVNDSEQQSIKERNSLFDMRLSRTI